MPNVAELRAVLSAPPDQITRDLTTAKRELTSTAQTAQTAAAQVSSAFAGVGSGVQKGASSIGQMRGALSDLSTQLNTLAGKPHNVQVEARLQSTQTQVVAVRQALDQLARPTVLNVELREAQVSAQIARIAAQLDRIQNPKPITVQIDSTKASQGLNELNGALTRLVAGAGAIAVLKGVGDAIGDSVSKTAQFQQIITNIGATSDASAAQLKQLSDTAIALGQASDTGAASAKDAAAAMYEMSKAGASVETMTGGAAKAVIQMRNAAADAGFGFAESAGLASNAINAFSRESLTYQQVANTFVGAANASTASLSSLKFGMAAVGPVAAQVGLSFNDTAAALAVLSANSLLGQDAGTSLKTMLMNLQPSTDAQRDAFQRLGLVTQEGASAFYTAEGSMRPLAEIAGVLQTAFTGMTDAQIQANAKILFGNDAVRAASIFYKEGAAGVAAMTSEMARVGDAGATATAMQASLAGQTETLRSKIEGLQIAFGMGLNPRLEEATGKANANEQAWANLTTAAERLGTGLGGLFAGIANGIGVLADLGTTADKITAIMEVKANEFRVSVGLMSQAQADAANQAIVAAVQHETAAAQVATAYSDMAHFARQDMEDLRGGMGQETAAMSAEMVAVFNSMHDGTVASSDGMRMSVVEIASLMADDTVRQAERMAVELERQAQIAGAGFGNALTNSLYASSKGIDQFWTDLTALMDQREALAQIGRINANSFSRGYIQGLKNDLAMAADSEKLGMYMDPKIGALINRNLPSLVAEDLRIRRMATPPGNLENENRRYWQAVEDQRKAEEERRKREAERGGGGPGRGGGGKGGGKGTGGKGVGTGAKTVKSAIQEQADQTKNIAAAINEGIAALSKLSDYTMPAGINQGLEAFAQSTALVMGRLQQVSLSFSSEGLAATSALADASQKVYSSLSVGIDYYSKLKEALDRGVSFGGEQAAQTQILAAQVAQITTAFGGLVPTWSSDQVANTSAFAEASQKVYGSLSTGLDYYSKLTEATQNGVSFGAEQTALTQQLAAAVVATTVEFGRLVPPWKDTQTKQVSEFSDASSKVLSSLSAGVDLYSKIAEATGRGVDFGADLSATTAQLSQTVIATTAAFGVALPAWRDQQVDQAGQFADASSKVLSAISATADVFAKLNDSQITSSTVQGLRGTADALGAVASYTTQSFAASMPTWTGQLPSQVSAVADSASKVISLVSGTADLFTKLQSGELEPGWDALRHTADALAAAASYTTQTFQATLPQWAGMSQDVATYADTSGKVVSTLTGAFTLFQQLQGADSLTVPLDAVRAVSEMLRETVIVFRAASQEWDTEGMATAAQVADSSARIISAVSGALDLFTKLQGVEGGVPTVALDQVMGLLEQALTAFQVRSAAWDAKGMAVAAEHAERAGRVAQALGSGVDVLVSLQDFQPPTDAAIDGYFTSLTIFLDRFSARAQAWQGLGLEKSAEVSGYVGTVAQGIGSAVDPIMSLRDFQPPGPEIVDVFFSSLDLVVTAFASRSAVWAANATEQTATFAANIQTVMGGISAGVDSLSKMSELAAAGFDPAAIDFAVGNLALAVQRARDLTGVLPPDQLAAASVTASGLSALFGSLKSALDALSGLSGAEVNPDAIQATVSALAGATSALMLASVGQVETDLGAAVDRMTAAGVALDQGLALGIDQGTPFIAAAVQRAMEAAMAAGEAAIGAASPAKEANKRWGLPLMRGGAGGILDNMGLMTRAARQALAETVAVPVPALPVPLVAPLPLAAPPGAVPGRGGAAGWGGGPVTIYQGDVMQVDGNVQPIVPGATHKHMVALRSKKTQAQPGVLR